MDAFSVLVAFPICLTQLCFSFLCEMEINRTRLPPMLYICILSIRSTRKRYFPYLFWNIIRVIYVFWFLPASFNIACYSLFVFVVVCRHIGLQRLTLSVTELHNRLYVDLYVCGHFISNPSYTVNSWSPCDVWPKFL